MSIPVLIIPILNRFDLLRQSLAAIDYPVDEILVLNNSGNDAETAGMQEDNPNLNLRILNLPSNLGFGGSWNLGIKLYPHAPYWTIGSADMVFLPGALEIMANASGPDNMIITKPGDWGFFSLGENIVKEVGLFDEYYYPAYYEDWDYFGRMCAKGLGGTQIELEIPINNNGPSQTVNSDSNLARKNDLTAETNKQYYESKTSSGDWTCKHWDLTKRRQNEWLS